MEKFGHMGFEARVFTPEKIEACITGIRSLREAGWDGTVTNLSDFNDIIVIEREQDSEFFKEIYLTFFELDVDGRAYVVYDAPRSR